MLNLRRRCIITTSVSEITLHKYNSSYLNVFGKPQPNASIQNITAKTRIQHLDRVHHFSVNTLGQPGIDKP